MIQQNTIDSSIGFRTPESSSIPPSKQVCVTNSEENVRIAEIKNALATIWNGYSMGELRFIGQAKTLCGYFDKLEVAAAHAYAAELEGYACYLCLNPVDQYQVNWAGRYNEPGLGKSTADAAITRRHWLLVDADPVRPAGVSSTEHERQEARVAIEKVCEHLHSLGWPDPILADSGNGFHLLYKIDLPADDNDLVYRVLHSIHNKFSSASVKFDTTVGNAARICRLYGTLNRKGETTSERPHRRSGILDTPNPIKTVATELITQLAKTVSVGGKISRNSNAASVIPESDPLESIIAESMITRARSKLRSLPIAMEGNHGSKRCFRAACLLILEFKLSVEQAYPLLKEYSDRCEPPWSEKELLHKLKSAEKKGKEREVTDTTHKPTTKRRSKADKILAMVQGLCELWRDVSNDEPYATAKRPIRGPQGTPLSGANQWHYENYQIKSPTFGDFVRTAYFEAEGKVAPKQALVEVIDTAASLASHRGTAEKVHIRIARHNDDTVFLDLGDDTWQAVEVTASGWSVVPSPKCKFRRTRGMLPLPVPERGGSIEQFQDLFNVEAEDLKLLVSWLVMAFHGQGPFPILTLFGEQGSAKSTTAELIRNLVDPNKAGARSVPKVERDLFIAGENSFIIAFDNLSRIDHETSDLLCRIATGAGYATRKLYTDCDEQLFSVCRPITLTSIAEVITRLDLLDRALVVELPVITSMKRKTAASVQAKFQAVRCQLLGLILDGVSTALTNYKIIPCKSNQRMADFEQWAAASMPAFGWTPADFMAAYAKNIEAAVGVALEGSPVVPALKALLKLQGGRWPQPGTKQGCQNLLRDLELQPEGPHFKEMRGWPSKYHLLATILRELAPALRRCGINITFHERETGGERVTPIVIESMAQGTVEKPPSPLD